MLAFAVALASFSQLEDGRWHWVAVISFAIAAICTAAWGWISWWRTELALRLDRPLPGPGLSGLALIAMLTLGATAMVAIGTARGFGH